MAFDQTVTAAAGVSSVAASAAIAVNPQNRFGGIAVVAASAVTTGGVLKFQGLDTGPNGAQGSWRDLGDPVTIAANGNTVVPLRKIAGAKLPEYVRISVTSRTDGTYTLSLVETAG